MQDIIFINELRIETVIGIFDWEREIKQPVILDIELATDIRKAADSDHIDDTIDYKTLTKDLITFVEASEFQLVEKLAEEICKLVMNQFGVPWMRLRLNKKGALRGATDVGIIIERGSRLA